MDFTITYMIGLQIISLKDKQGWVQSQLSAYQFVMLLSMQLNNRNQITLNL